MVVCACRVYHKAENHLSAQDWKVRGHRIAIGAGGSEPIKTEGQDVLAWPGSEIR